MLLSLQYLGVVGATLAGVTVVVLSIAAFKKHRVQRLQWARFDNSPTIAIHNDDILSVRKKKEHSPDSLLDEPTITSTDSCSPKVTEKSKPAVQILRVMAKEKTSFAGYELLQALLSADFRFGKMNIFHYHNPHSHEVLFSLASAIEPGTFDLVNMGACTCPGLTLFMQTKNNASDDDVYQKMRAAAERLAEDLDGVLLETTPS